MNKWIFLFISMGCLAGCLPERNAGPLVISGETMGTYYRVTCNCDGQGIDKVDIDSILIVVNESASTYIESSIISQFNRADSTMALDFSQVSGRYSTIAIFDLLWKTSLEVAERSGGYYDPTIMPLVNFWGFGYRDKKAVQEVDSTEVLRLRALADHRRLKRTRKGDVLIYRKPQSGVQIDYSSIAKGLGVDIISAWLSSNGCDDHLVDIGGELFASGLSRRGEAWVTGINVPDPEAAQSDIFLRLQVTDKGIASSGNYRNFYEVDGVTYGHTINPFTGYPEENRLLSNTVIAEDCMTADAWATAFMAMGLERSMELVEKIEGVEALFVYNENGTFSYSATPAFNEYIVE